MSKVEDIAAQLEKLSPAEILQVRNWLDDFIEDQLSFTDEFEATIRESERDIAEGKASRTRQTPPAR
jgi:hypothetical protein